MNRQKSRSDKARSRIAASDPRPAHERDRRVPHRASRALQGSWLIPAALALIALIVRVWALRFEPWVTVDGTEYIRFADALRRGQAFASIFPPGYPALIALVRFVIEDRVLAAAGVSVVCGSLLVLPVWHLAREVAGPRWAVLAAALVALHPSLLEFSTLTMSESAFLLAVYVAVAVAPLLSGAAAGAAFAIRPEGLLPALALFVRQLALPNPKRLVGASLLLGGFLIVAIPTWVWFHATLGEWTLTPKISAFRVGGESWQEQEKHFGAADSSAAYGLDRLTADLPGALARYPANAVAHGRSLLHLWPLPLLVVAILGLIRRRGRESLPLLHLAAIPLLGLSEQPRFVLVAIPALAILATIALARAAPGPQRLSLGGLVLAGAIWCAIALREDLVLPFDGYEEAHKEAGLWLGGASQPGDAVLDRKPYVAFYADRAYRVMPDAPYDSLIAFVQARDIRYLIVDEGVARVFRPQLLPLLYDTAFREGEHRLECVYLGGHHRGYSIGIFRVLRPDERPTGRPPVANIKWRN